MNLYLINSQAYIYLNVVIDKPILILSKKALGHD